MAFAAAAVERAMTYQRVIMRARAGSLTWLQAADILNIYPRSLRRWWARYEQDPKLGLLDRRRRRPAHSRRPAPRCSGSDVCTESTTKASTCGTSISWPGAITR